MVDYSKLLKTLDGYDKDELHFDKWDYERKIPDTEVLETYGPYHWMTYGTGVVDIPNSFDLHIYEQAVARCGIPELFILPYSYKDPKNTSVSSLNCYGYRDLQKFWDIVKELRNAESLAAFDKKLIKDVAETNKLES